MFAVEIMIKLLCVQVNTGQNVKRCKTRVNWQLRFQLSRISYCTCILFILALIKLMECTR